MREADLMFSRRRFLITSLKASAGVAAGLIVGPEVFEMLDRMGPRRLMVPVAPPVKTLEQLLKEIYSGLRADISPLQTPLLPQLQGKRSVGQWGGKGVSFDMTTTFALSSKLAEQR